MKRLLSLAAVWVGLGGCATTPAPSPMKLVVTGEAATMFTASQNSASGREMLVPACGLGILIKGRVGARLQL